MAPCSLVSREDADCDSVAGKTLEVNDEVLGLPKLQTRHSPTSLGDQRTVVRVVDCDVKIHSRDQCRHVICEHVAGVGGGLRCRRIVKSVENLMMLLAKVMSGMW